jgi:protein-S-isoprenylcysteine O-methyltransferase Ste14
MTDATWIFIAGCWLGWLVYWVVMAFRTKRTVERAGLIQYRIVGLAVFVATAAVCRLLQVGLNSELWGQRIAPGVAADCVVAAGVAFSVWARVTLGRNWSAEVTFKQDHELIESGPYALVRHPIYTGLLLMALGAAIDGGRLIGFILVLTLGAALWWKVHLEEEVMNTHFPDAYADYRSRTPAIIPFLR